ncbi:MULTISPECIES: MFS transporter [Pseudomonas]|uniref:Putative tartrate transporter n=1 Tax=Pseudomonas fluorescens TaxID=294 RepID=A0A125QF44_PSEFL|nr:MULTISPECIES: MFS transporter [Pseudomonas]PNB58929.1 MFS transporter [Pseudomonas sp. FW305-130]KWV77054.1 putative tartrate transporter [Pseudomonas fluorescens]MCA4964539.1 MFS transporter [Pseudomonas sp. Y24-6]MCE0881959.1 MFS transporter [Pseudomonas putida]MCE1083653.1 MFS transporter [Pseudomonas asiatica]
MTTTAATDAVPHLLQRSHERIEKVYRKVTLRLMTFIFVAWVLNYLDRVNISFAQVYLKHDLGMSDAAYGLGVSLFFIGYIALEIPSTLYLQKIGARLTITRIMVLWGLISASMAFMTTPTEFYIARALLGAAEAGFWPGIILYLTYWYPGARRARITSRFLLAIAAAGIIGGPLSGWILTHFVDVMGMKNWQWMFILEGLPAAVMGVMAYFYLVDKPEQAKWLDDEEKSIILDALAADRAGKKPVTDKRHAVLAALKDPRVYVLAAGWATVPLCGTILNYWTPTIIRNTGIQDVLHVGLLSTVPYIVGAIAMILIARSSDIRLERRKHFFFSIAFGALGACLLPHVVDSAIISITCLAMIAVSYFGAAAIIWSIPPAYLNDESAAGGISAISSLGQIGAFCAPIGLGWINTVTGSLAIGLTIIGALVLAGGMAVLIAVPANALSEKPLTDE